MFDYWLENPIPHDTGHEYIDEATERLLAEMEGTQYVPEVHSDNMGDTNKKGEKHPFYAFEPSNDGDLSDCPF